jgi:hypothetical protein
MINSRVGEFSGGGVGVMVASAFKWYQSGTKVVPKWYQSGTGDQRGTILESSVFLRDRGAQGTPHRDT